jgi:putative peptide zinc metalloprotease protein
MNITEALNVALPEIPARTVAQRYPRMDPNCTFREHIEEGRPIIRVYVPSAEVMFKFPPQNWEIIQLFDGKRTYAEIAEITSARSGLEYSEDEIREFAASLDEGGFWYKTSQEKNISLLQQDKATRQKKAKSRYADISLVIFPAFNPDKFLTWLYGYTKFIYTRWFTVLTLAAFAFSIGLTVDHWREIGRDTGAFYSFSGKTFWDIVILYALGVFVVATHEFAHAHACKHYGGRVPAMGFSLIYLTPGFYTDTTEGMVTGSRYQRLVISLAGIWSELMICSIATPIWWATAPYTALHEGAYFLMMLTGLTSLLINWNPLMKLDGYYMLCEMIAIPDLKEASTLYVAAWVRRHVWRLPVEVPFVPKHRRLGYIVYALLSGFYSYTVLFVVARFAGNIAKNFDPQWSFIPEFGAAFLVFRSRIRLLVNFMKFVYLDKKDRLRAWFQPSRTVVLLVAAAVILLLPLWHESTSGRFILEPAHRAVVRAAEPGIVTRVFRREGEQVSGDSPLFEMVNLPLNSRLAHSHAELSLANSRVNTALHDYRNLGSALHERERSQAQTAGYQAQVNDLNVFSPLAGTVLTPRTEDKLGAYVTTGSELAEIGDLRQMRLRLYISEYELYKIQVGAVARVQVDGIWGIWKTTAASISPAASEPDAGLNEVNQYKGLTPPNFYAVTMILENHAGRLKPGMAGYARVYGPRKSLIGLAWNGLENFAGRKLW